MTSGHSHVTRNVMWSHLPRLDTSPKAEQVRYMILIRLYNSNSTLPYIDIKKDTRTVMRTTLKTCVLVCGMDLKYVVVFHGQYANLRKLLLRQK